MNEVRDTDYYNEPRYQDTVTHDQFSLIVSTGPMWNRLSTRFRTPYNHDPVKLLEGPAGSIFTSNDGGNWYFRASFMPLKITWDKEHGYRRNETDPWVERNGLAPYARMITKAFDSVEYPIPADLPDVEYTDRRTETRLLSPLEALDSGYDIRSVDDLVWSTQKLPGSLSGDPFQSTTYFPHSTGSFDDQPHFWLRKPVAPVPPPPEPVESDYQYQYDEVTVSGTAPNTTTTVTTHTVTLGLYNTDHNRWQDIKDTYDAEYAQYVADLSAWNDWKSQNPVYVLIRDGHVRNILSSSRRGGQYLFVGLAPFYNENGRFLGWAAAQEKRVVLTHAGGETAGEWVPCGTGIMAPLHIWNEKNIGNWVPAPDDFDFNKDPRAQGPF